MMASLTSDVDYLFSTPTSVEIIGVDVDVDRIISTVAPIDGDQSKVKKFMILAGYNRSIFEHLDLEIPLNTPAISAVKAIQLASDQGIPIHNIDITNIDTILPILNLSQEVITNIKNAVNQGKEVKVQERNITYKGWTGAGYIIIDPETGAGAYMISGGMAGALQVFTDPDSTLNEMLGMLLVLAGALLPPDRTDEVKKLAIEIMDVVMKLTPEHKLEIKEYVRETGIRAAEATKRMAITFFIIDLALIAAAAVTGYFVGVAVLYTMSSQHFMVRWLELFYLR
jgi:hypothetical protein